MTIANIRLISMYLPQYHPIPENDEWWGRGFTEWTNVRKAAPRFPGHYQPHVPGKLGYYDLRDPEARQAQADLAREHGIHGFCYYHYWFNGKRLLETPFNEVLRTGKPDFPFCICWANENWTKRWDGYDKEVLMAQHYSDEDSRHFIESLLPAFRDERYIRINGRPVLLLYRTGLLPDAKRTAEIWRSVAMKEGMELYLVRVENHMEGGEVSPTEIGFDAAMEFAPYWGAVGEKVAVAREENGSDIPLPADMSVHDYETCMLNMLARQTPEYKLFRGVFPAWDNSARRKTGSTLFLNSSPEIYAYWLTRVLRYTLENFTGDERLVFINAWNEWGEGCHLEPDEKYGNAYLRATQSALEQAQEFSRLLTLGLNVSLGSQTFNYSEWYRLLQTSRFPHSDEERQQLAAYASLFQGPIGYEINNELRELKQLLQHKDHTIDALLNSASWKLTAPLRKFIDRLRK